MKRLSGETCVVHSALAHSHTAAMSDAYVMQKTLFGDARTQCTQIGEKS